MLNALSRPWAPMLICAALGCASSVGAQEAPAQPPPLAQEAPISSSAAAPDSPDEQELDLDEPEPARPARPSCDAKLPSGGLAGAWSKQLGPLSNCSARQIAKTQYPSAAAVSDALWCSDPAGAKARARAQAQRQRAPSKVARSLVEPAAELSATPAPKAGLLSWLRPPSIKNTSRSRSEPEPPLDPVALLAAQWDEREARMCAKGPAPEMGPSVATYAVGRAGACEGALIETTLATGRHAGSRLSWVASACPGSRGVDAASAAAAVASGQGALDAWQENQLRQAAWRGPAPRPAVARSADGRTRLPPPIDPAPRPR